MYIIDEVKLYEELMENEEMINYDTLMRIRAYIKFLCKEGKSPSETYDIISKLLEENLCGYREYMWKDRLKNLITKTRNKNNRNILTPKSIRITYDELKWIRERNDINVEAFLFALLVIAKSTCIGEQLWVKCRMDDIFKMSHIKLPKMTGVPTKKKRGIFCKELKDKGYIQVGRAGGRGLYKLLYGSNNSKEDGIDLTLTNENMDYIVYNYHKWRGLRVINCERCGCLTLAKSGNTRYCGGCAKTIINEQKLKYYYKKH